MSTRSFPVTSCVYPIEKKKVKSNHFNHYKVIFGSKRKEHTNAHTNVTEIEINMTRIRKEGK